MTAWTAAAIASGADMVIGGQKYVEASGSNVEITLSVFASYAADLLAKELAGQAQVVPFLSIAVGFHQLAIDTKTEHAVIAH